MKKGEVAYILDFQSANDISYDAVELESDDEDEQREQLAEAFDSNFGVWHVVENTPENRAVLRAILSEMERAAAREVQK